MLVVTNNPYCGNVLEYGTCYGVVWDVLWRCMGRVMALYGTCYGVVWDVLWRCMGRVMALYGTCYGVVCNEYSFLTFSHVVEESALSICSFVTVLSKCFYGCEFSIKRGF